MGCYASGMAAPGAWQGPLDRIAAFRFVYIGIFAYVLLAVVSLELSENLLDSHFKRAVAKAVQVNPADGPIIEQIQDRLSTVLDSPWLKLGGIRLNVLVLGWDGRTPIYLGGRTLPPPPGDPLTPFREARKLLPAITTVDARVPLDSLFSGAVWVVYGLVFIPLLLIQQRRVARRDQTLYAAAVVARDASARRAQTIEHELSQVSHRLHELEPMERAQALEIEKLERERTSLRTRMAELSGRVDELRDQAAHSTELESERRTLEEMLDEALHDLEHKEGEIGELTNKLEHASKGRPPGKTTRASEQLAKRMRTLYRNLEIDDRAIQNILALGDETQRLRAEECLKKLDNDPGSAGTRRKVGGLPSGQSIFELGFAGKSRIYYAKGRQRQFRVLAVGGKASQKTDLEYLSRVSLD